MAFSGRNYSMLLRLAYCLYRIFQQLSPFCLRAVEAGEAGGAYDISKNRVFAKKDLARPRTPCKDSRRPHPHFIKEVTARCTF